jgi:hypothetical protein
LQRKCSPLLVTRFQAIKPIGEGLLTRETIRRAPSGMITGAIPLSGY